jgi:hypothetical protein
MNSKQRFGLLTRRIELLRPGESSIVFGLTAAVVAAVLFPQVMLGLLALPIAPIALVFLLIGTICVRDKSLSATRQVLGITLLSTGIAATVVGSFVSAGMGAWEARREQIIARDGLSGVEALPESNPFARPPSLPGFVKPCPWVAPFLVAPGFRLWSGFPMRRCFAWAVAVAALSPCVRLFFRIMWNKLVLTAWKKWFELPFGTIQVGDFKFIFPTLYCSNFSGMRSDPKLKRRSRIRVGVILLTISLGAGTAVLFVESSLGYAIAGGLLGFLVGSSGTSGLRPEQSSPGKFPNAHACVFLSGGSWVVALAFVIFFFSAGYLTGEGASLLLPFFVLPVVSMCWLIGGPFASRIGKKALEQMRLGIRPESELSLANLGLALSRAFTVVLLLALLWILSLILV